MNLIEFKNRLQSVPRGMEFFLKLIEYEAYEIVKVGSEEHLFFSRWIDLDRPFGDVCFVDIGLYLKDILCDCSFEWLGAQDDSCSHDGGDLVFRFKLDGEFYEGRGTYSSWSDCVYPELKDFYKVEPYEKTVNFYRRKN